MNFAQIIYNAIPLVTLSTAVIAGLPININWKAKLSYIISEAITGNK